eukprot:c15839_g1_i1.p1 GENE.c15839_g1_i1~~c15839_g1_i1.p1  ORF type:complete len:180 (+),score=27.39 c15839_g1_i1:51-542(+)
MVKNFIISHLKPLLSGKSHHEGRKIIRSTNEICLMSISCFFYFIPAWFWFLYQYQILSSLFCCTAIFSFLADGVRVPFAFIRVLDRCFGTICLISSAVINSKSLFLFSLVLFTCASSLWWLGQSRKVAQTNPNNRTAYLFYHGVWHVYGSLALCFTTYICHLP